MHTCMLYVVGFGDILEYVYSVCCIYYLEIDSTYHRQ